MPEIIMGVKPGTMAKRLGSIIERAPCGAEIRKHYPQRNPANPRYFVWEFGGTVGKMFLTLSDARAHLSIAAPKPGHKALMANINRRDADIARKEACAKLNTTHKGRAGQSSDNKSKKK